MIPVSPQSTATLCGTVTNPRRLGDGSGGAVSAGNTGMCTHAGWDTGLLRQRVPSSPALHRSYLALWPEVPSTCKGG